MPEIEPPDVDELQRRAAKRIGSVVSGKWRLERVLGVGGTAAVYAAEHRNGKRVAVKVLHAGLAANPDAVERFLDEAHAANRVGHPGVVSVLDDATTDDGCALLVMELLDGETLDARLGARPDGLDVIEVLLVADQLLDVLAAAHERGIVHRDIKPENVFLTRSGRVKLLDFGIARLAETRRTLRTQAGSTMGTPAFMAPEQARGRWNEIDSRTDLWAVGATLFVALTGRLVHEGETMNEELLSAMTRPAPSLGVVAPALPACVAAIVDRALAFETQHRFGDARSMQTAVQAALRELGGESATLEVPGARESRNSTGPTTHRPVTTSNWRLTRPEQPNRALIGGLIALPLAVVVTVLGAEATESVDASVRSGVMTSVSAFTSSAVHSVRARALLAVTATEPAPSPPPVTRPGPAARAQRVAPPSRSKPERVADAPAPRAAPATTAAVPTAAPAAVVSDPLSRRK